MERKQMLQNALDATPHLGVLATLMGWLPPLAAALSIVWIGLQIAEKISGKPLHILLAPICERIAAVWRRLCS